MIMQIPSFHHQFLLPNPGPASDCCLSLEPVPMRDHPGAGIWGECYHDYRLLSTYSVPGMVPSPLYALSHFPSQQLLGLEVINILIFNIFKKLVLEREEGSGREGDRSIPLLGTKPATPACAPIWSRTSDLLVHGMLLN